MALKTLVVTTSRADYGLLTPLLEELEISSDFELQLVATGSHLSEHHGLTKNLITEDGFALAGLVEMNPHSNDSVGTAQAVARGLAGFSQMIMALKPNLMVVLGDRFELLAASTAALLHRVPVAHLYGGETTEGALDEAIRHGVTKMAALHFVSLPGYEKRVIQMGEEPDRVFQVGALGIDNVHRIHLMDLEELRAHSGVDFSKPVALMTFHPVTLDGPGEAARQIEEVLAALESQDFLTLVTMPNADPASDQIYQRIKAASLAYPERIKLVKNLGQRGYLSAMKRAHLMLGNSSSGVIETPSFGLPTLNIGDRQKGRFCPENVIQCDCTKSAILEALAKAQSPQFRSQAAAYQSPFGQGDCAKKIITTLINWIPVLQNQPERLLKKHFHDL
ncbi:MAG: UDP-N-acetyl-D-glucosamine 2-epimerase, UDP-hydrolysing [Candidatus Lambdaproteobacteria bacterium RIFOXYD2_FULL_50_16]|uniref:UDP-N-acetyl-D-glucosamine 2-epimerase, UDP-hydrolysing n=1 Tax=Candidatus Lambdaproteobacteria bacterium RIFOXYD2_FULL_50_16 TaxID=1817772 RepID=A0A1F6G850_9PROT|nr:MAG: UDP-N-acetyl-D-glucosamine 2-epimerase, UDP-hydrolysing [Candidatus Lambdaproteobacteria bacterium RIFOXYD2_FULL_50_16]